MSETVTPRMVMLRTIASMLDHPSVYMGGPSQRNMRRAEEILAAVAPLIAAEALERAAVVVETHQAEVQQNINDNIAEVRVVQIKPSDNWPLIKARDWLKYIAAAIRALKETT